MPERGHFVKLPVGSMDESVSCNPRVECNNAEISELLKDLYEAVKQESYVAPQPDKPPLEEIYIFDQIDQKLILKDLSIKNFVGKIKDIGEGAKKRIKKGYSQEYLYVFQYVCELKRRDFEDSGIKKEKVLIYIKINNRKEPYKKVFIVSFHKNRTK